MQLYYTPSACSIIPHIVLEEIGERFVVHHVARGQTRSDAFLCVNPKGKIPVLVLNDETVVTENPVILQLLAKMYPARGLLPTDRIGEFEALQICEYLIGTVQVFGLTRLFRPSVFCEDEGHWDSIRKEGEKVLLKGFDLIATRLEGRPFLFDRFSVADASLFYFELHASRLRITMPALVRCHFDMMMKRPAVRKVLAREGLNMADFVPS
jgi:glutathione S-transferase